ncbi:MAG: CDP-alcohol phosphatidyltransferase family protein [Candidatus Chromulinivorax sp.]
MKNKCIQFSITYATKITLLRIFLTPIIVLALCFKQWQIALWLFFIACSTDFFDGYYARLYDEESQFGKVLDPLADKILLCSVVVALYRIGFLHMIPGWFVLLLLVKEIFFLIGAFILIFIGKKIVINPSWLAKGTTCFMMIFLMYMLFIEIYNFPIFFMQKAIYAMTAALIIISLDYAYKFYKLLDLW